MVAFCEAKSPTSSSTSNVPVSSANAPELTDSDTLEPLPLSRTRSRLGSTHEMDATQPTAHATREIRCTSDSVTRTNDASKVREASRRVARDASELRDDRPGRQDDTAFR